MKKFDVFSAKLGKVISIEIIEDKGFIFNEFENLGYSYWADGGWTKGGKDGGDWMNNGWSKYGGHWINGGWTKSSKNDGEWINGGWSKYGGHWINGGWSKESK